MSIFLNNTASINYMLPVLAEKEAQMSYRAIIHEQNLLLKEKTQQLEQLNSSIILIVAELVENRDRLTGEHIKRTTKYLEILIDAMLERKVYANELQNWDKEVAIASAQLHDVGKIAISDLILNKSSRLTKEEYEQIKTHATVGEQIIDSMIIQTNGSVFLHHAKYFAGYHHEHWDGSGYPYGLKEDHIPLHGRIMAIVDVYDALVSERVYKQALSHEEAVSIIMSEKSKHFDPKIADVFFEVHNNFQSEAKKI